MQDKVTTPSEPVKQITKWESAVRPDHIVAEQSVNSQANIHENYRIVFSQYGDFQITTGTTFTPQFHPWYLGMAYPFTLPVAVGGYDVPNTLRWRRPEDEDIPWPRRALPDWLESLGGKHGSVGPATKVSLFDLTRGLPQRIEGQYRRHWGFTPGLWNLYFRERLNLGVSLRVKNFSKPKQVDTVQDEDAAMTAASLVKKLEHGYYRDQNNKKRKINGDFSKLCLAEHLSELERKLLADFRFRCKALPGTQEIRTKIGFWYSGPRSCMAMEFS